MEAAATGRNYSSSRNVPCRKLHINTKIYSAAAVAPALAPLAAQAQTTTLAQDNASGTAYVDAAGDNSSYGQGQNGGSGFGAFQVAATGSAGTFEYTSKESEDGSANIDTPSSNSNGSPLSFGVYAQTLGSSTTISRTFNTGPTVGATFSLDFVTGYNDGVDANGNAGAGMAGVSLTNAAGTFGTFSYQSNDQYLFNGATVAGQGYTTGALHLVYDITSATTYSLAVTGPFTFNGTGTFAGPVTGFQVAQTNSGVADGAHNAYFNNLLETAPAAAPVPEASSSLGFAALLALGGLTLAARKRRAHA